MENILSIDEEVMRAPSVLANTMFADRSGWFSDLNVERMQREVWGLTPPVAVWFQQARCTACGALHGVSQPISNRIDDEQVLAILAAYPEGTWLKVTREHVDTCRNRRVWDAMIAANPALSRYFANYREAMALEREEMGAD